MLDGFLSQVMLRQLRYCDSQAIRDGLAEVPHRERRAFPGASAPLLPAYAFQSNLLAVQIAKPVRLNIRIRARAWE
jgi:hypothetical protein